MYLSHSVFLFTFHFYCLNSQMLFFINQIYTLYNIINRFAAAATHTQFHYFPFSRKSLPFCMTCIFQTNWQTFFAFVSTLSFFMFFFYLILFSLLFTRKTIIKQNLLNLTHSSDEQQIQQYLSDTSKKIKWNWNELEL